MRYMSEKLAGRREPGLGDQRRLRAVLRTMSNETNLRILKSLATKPAYPSELARQLSLPRSLVNKRLAAMEEKGLLGSRDEIRARRKVRLYTLLSKDLQFSMDLETQDFEIGRVEDRHLKFRLSDPTGDPAYNYLEPHRYGLKEAVAAWINRTFGDEKLVKIFFYEDELPKAEHRSFVRELGLPGKGGRLLRIIRHQSLRDLKTTTWPEKDGSHEEERQERQEPSPSSGFYVLGQGDKAFTDSLRHELIVQRQRRRKDTGKDKNRAVDTGLIPARWRDKPFRLQAKCDQYRSHGKPYPAQETISSQQDGLCLVRHPSGLLCGV